MKSRPRVETPLSRWLKKNRMSLYAFGQKADINRNRIWEFARGLRVPALITALRIEWATDGEVPCSSWLTLPVMRVQWESFAQKARQRVAIDVSYRRRKLPAYQKQRRKMQKLAEDPFFKLEDPYASEE